MSLCNKGVVQQTSHEVVFIGTISILAHLKKGFNKLVQKSKPQFSRVRDLQST